MITRGACGTSEPEPVETKTGNTHLRITLGGGGEGALGLQTESRFSAPTSLSPNATLERIHEFDCGVIVTDHSQYDYASIVEKAKLVVDTRNATEGIDAAHIVRC